MLLAGPAHIAPCIHHGMFDELNTRVTSALLFFLDQRCR